MNDVSSFGLKKVSADEASKLIHKKRSIYRDMLEAFLQSGEKIMQVTQHGGNSALNGRISIYKVIVKHGYQDRIHVKINGDDLYLIRK